MFYFTVLTFLDICCFVMQDEVGVVFMSTDTRHGFEEGTYVTFHGVKGMTEVNGQEFKITVPSLYFYIIGSM